MRQLSHRGGGQKLTQVKRNAFSVAGNFQTIQTAGFRFSASPAQKLAIFEDKKQIGFNNFRPENPPPPCYFLCRFEHFLAGKIQPGRTVHL
jgi:hypothetical protein